MLGLVLKATLLDCWKYSAPIFMGNLALIAAGFGASCLLRATSAGLAWAAFPALALSLGLLTVVGATFVCLLHRWLTLQPDPGLRLWQTTRPLLGPLLIWAMTVMGIASLVVLAIDRFPRGAAAGLMAGSALACALVAMYFPPALARCGGHAGRAWAVALLLAYDNLAFSLTMLILTALLLASSVLLFPGPGGGYILLHHALRLRMPKYDQPAGVRPRTANWCRLLQAERQAQDRLSWRSLLFPWKS